MRERGKGVLVGEPERGEAGILRRRHVLEVLPVDRFLGVGGPGFRDLKLTHQAEFHLATLPVARERMGRMNSSCESGVMWPPEPRGSGYSTAGRIPDATTA